jgi:diacylglycerol kinase family enzyme
MRKLADLRPQTARFAGDGFEYNGQFLMFAVGLTRASGGGTMVTPMASATDGLLDLCIVEDMSRAEFARTVLRVKRGEHVGQDGVQYVQVRSVTIESSDPVAVNVDGESSNAKRLVYRARARDLWVHVASLPGEAEA